MPLSPPVDREPLHRRRVECRGYRRKDGLWDIEGHIVDIKTYSFPNDFRGEIRAGEPLHEMWIRLTVDDDLKVHEVEAVTDASPYRMCPDITPAFGVLKGLRIAPGWTQAVKDRLGGPQGCTHLVELLGPVATVAYQTMVAVRKQKLAETPRGKRPGVLNSCYAYRTDSEIVRERWPDFYTGPGAASP
jgi:hypothetical protein